MDSSSIFSIQVVQTNLMRSRNALQDLLIYSRENRIDIALVSEPPTHNNIMIGIKDVLIIQSNDNKHRNKSSILIFNKSLQIDFSKIIASPLFTALQLTVHGLRTYLVSVYGDPECQLDSLLDNVSSVVEGSQCIIGGDLNARSSLWGDQVTNPRGRIVEEFICLHNLTLMNQYGTPTFLTIRSGRVIQSSIDLTLASPACASKISHWRTDLDIVPRSDHVAILFQIGNCLRFNKVQHGKRLYSTNNADWSKFTDCFVQEISRLNVINIIRDANCTTTTIEKAVDLLTSASQYACHTVLKLLPYNKANSHNHKNYNKNLPWINDEIILIRRNIRLTKRRLLRCSRGHRLDLENALQEIKKQYTTVISRSKASSWKKHCEKQGKETIWSSVYRVIKHEYSSDIPIVKDSLGNVMKQEEVLDDIKLRFFPSDNPADDSLYHHQIRTSADDHGASQTRQIEPKISMKEIEYAFKSMNPKKAPGRDHLTADICYQCFKSLPALFYWIFNKCLELEYFPCSWKVAQIVLIPKPSLDGQSTKEVRPIGLLPVYSKVLERIMYQRLLWHINRKEGLNKNQHGFLPRRSAENVLINLVEQIKSAWHSKRKVALLSFDIKGAFNAAWWPKAIVALRAILDNNTSLLGILEDYFNKRYAEVSYGTLSRKIQCERGCIQGSILGPIIWNLVMNDVFDYSINGVAVQAYADDITALITAQNDTLLNKAAQRFTNHLSTWAGNNKLNFAVDKCCATYITRGKTFNLNLTLNGHLIRNVNHQKILGVIFDSKLTWANHIKYALAKASRISLLMRRLASRSWGINQEILTHIYKMTFVPIVCYGARSWGDACSKKYIKKLINAGQRDIIIKCIRAYRTTSLASALAISGIPPLHQVIYTTYKNHLDLMYKKRIREVEVEDLFPLSDLIYPSYWTHINHDLTGKNIERLHTIPNMWRIYTDGSVIDGKVGGSLVALNPDGMIVRKKKFCLAPICNIYQAESFSIWRALKFAESLNMRRLQLFSDSASVLQSILNLDDHNCLVTSSRQQIWEMMRNGFYVQLIWVKGHNGIVGNALADECAKEAALQQHENHESYNYAKQSTSVSSRLSKERILENWKNEYNNYNNTWLKKFIPTIEERFKLSSACFATPEVVWFISGHGPFCTYLKRVGIVSTEFCTCREKKQDPEHLLLDCSLTESILEVRKLRASREALCIGEIIRREEGLHVFEAACCKIAKLIVAVNKNRTN